MLCAWISLIFFFPIEELINVRTQGNCVYFFVIICVGYFFREEWKERGSSPPRSNKGYIYYTSCLKDYFEKCCQSFFLKAVTAPLHYRHQNKEHLLNQGCKNSKNFRYGIVRDRYSVLNRFSSSAFLTFRRLLVAVFLTFSFSGGILLISPGAHNTHGQI